jgi:hypothetical protein
LPQTCRHPPDFTSCVGPAAQVANTIASTPIRSSGNGAIIGIRRIHDYVG